MTNHRSSAAGPRMQRLGLVATAAALAALTALAFLLLHPGASSAAQAKGVVSTASSSLGRILVDSRGHTLYLFGKDRNDRSGCAGMCASFWPPLIVSSGKPIAGAGAKASLLGTTKRADGRMQVTYNRRPLYTFVKDTKKGQTSGEGLNAFGAVWNAVSPAGMKIVRQQPAPKVTPPSNGIPQNNGGDHDSDNNGGTSDGDGNI